MAWLVNLLVAFFRLMRYSIPIVAGFIVIVLVSNWMGPTVAHAYLGDFATLLVAGVLGVAAGTFLAGFCGRL